MPDTLVTRRKIYLAGPISGHDPSERITTFRRRQELLEQAGFDVVNPCELSPPDVDWNKSLRTDIKALMDCDVIYLQQGWERSSGVRLELHIALSLGFSVMVEETCHMVSGIKSHIEQTNSSGKIRFLGDAGDPRPLPDPKLGIGEAPTRTTTLPEDGAERKKFPVASGVLDYFPDALVSVANVSYIGNEQHNSGQPLHWARSKSVDQDDTILRHFLQRGARDKDGIRHSAKMAWRVLALLQLEIEADGAGP